MPTSSSSRVRAGRRKHGASRSRILKAALGLLLAQAAVVGASAECLKFADAPLINQLFSDGGPDTKVLLCPSRTYRLDSTIIFTAADQELATEGYPEDGRRARLLVNSKDLATAVQGDCRRCARVSLRSLIVDGNRRKKGRMIDAALAGGLIVLGGNEAPSVTHCVVKDPRGWTAIHIREGDLLSCSGAVVAHNEIGPVGEEYIEAVDGPDPEMSPIGRPLGDGLSIACRNSSVQDNTFHDNTDAAIVVYCSPGSNVTRNQIFARTRSAMAGILLVDSTPFDGNYTGTAVSNNIIDATSFPIRVGIGLGAAVWSDDTDTILTGGSVTENVMRGLHMGFGIAASGLLNWKIMENWSEAQHSGVRTKRCFDEPINPSPVAFLYNKKTIGGSEIQEDFVDGEFAYAVCIDGGDEESNHPDAVGQPVEIPVEVKPEETKEAAAPPVDLNSIPSTGSEVMDGILLHSQQRMLEAIGALGLKLDGLHGESDIKRGFGDDIISPLKDRIKRLEEERNLLSFELKQLRDSMAVLSQEMDDAEREDEIAIEALAQIASQAGKQHETHSDVKSDSHWGLVWKMLLGQLAFAIVVILYQKWASMRDSRRLGKRV